MSLPAYVSRYWPCGGCGARRPHPTHRQVVRPDGNRSAFVDEIASMFSKLLKRKIAYIDDLRAEIRKPSRSVICCANQSPHVNAPIDRYFQCLACRFAGSSGDQNPTLT